MNRTEQPGRPHLLSPDRAHTVAKHRHAPTPANAAVATPLLQPDHSQRNAAGCALLVAALVLLIHGNTNEPFMDDFSYAKTALDFARTGHFIYNGWATAMLGWQVLWGALFIKLFGFSFRVLQLSMIPLAMASVYLFHQILRRFGITPANAVIGTLTMALSPLFLPLAASFMTDIPGLLVILICIYMCQRAVAATSDSATLLWLTSATLLNIAGGTVRQIAWLGALVMVPSTAWLLRSRRGIKLAAVVLFLFTFVSVLACIHWFNQQPYSVPEPIIAGPLHLRMLVHLAAQVAKTVLCTLLLSTPVLIGASSIWFRLRFISRIRVAVVLAFASVIALALHHRGALDPWIMPWLAPLLAKQGMAKPYPTAATTVVLSLRLKVAISLFVIGASAVFLEQLTGCRRPSLKHISSRSRTILAIVIPFTISYICLLMPRGTFSAIQDRYVLGLVPMAIVLLLALYQTCSGGKLPPVSLLALGIFAGYAALSGHDIFAESRAIGAAVRMLRSAGIPARSIQAGLASDGWADDGWVQIKDGGHLDESRIRVPAGTYHLFIPDPRIPPECLDWFGPLAYDSHPKYFLLIAPASCLSTSRFAPVPYSTWLPPWSRSIYIEQLRPANH